METQYTLGVDMLVFAYSTHNKISKYETKWSSIAKGWCTNFKKFLKFALTIQNMMHLHINQGQQHFIIR